MVIFSQLTDIFLRSVRVTPHQILKRLEPRCRIVETLADAPPGALLLYRDDYDDFEPAAESQICLKLWNEPGGILKLQGSWVGSRFDHVDGPFADVSALMTLEIQALRREDDDEEGNGMWRPLNVFSDDLDEAGYGNLTVYAQFRDAQGNFLKGDPIPWTNFRARPARSASKLVARLALTYRHGIDFRDLMSV